MARYRKRPVEVEAISVREALAHAAEHGWDGLPLWLTVEIERGNVVLYDDRIVIHVEKSGGAPCSIDLDGWIIAEPDGHGIYPCTGEQFAATYDPVI